MAHWNRFASAVGEARIILVLGGLYTVIAAVHIILLWWAGQPLSDVVPTHLLIGLPGITLLYGGYRLPDSELRPDVYPRVVARCFAGIGVMLGVVGLLAIGTPGGLHRPFFTPTAGTALGSVAGFGIGLNEARALSRAHEAEQHRDELLQERTLREHIVQTSPIGIAVFDADGQISVVNEHAAEIAGFSEDDLLGTEYDTPMFKVTDADGNPVEDFIFEQVLATGEAVYGVERQFTRPDEQQIWISMNAAPIYDSSGNVTSVVLTVEDITERKEQQGRLEQQNNRLESFAGMLAHELRNPLTIAQIYHPQAVEGDGDAANQVETALNRIEEMIDVLLITVRTSDVDIQYQPVGIENVATDAWADLSTEAETAAANLIVEAEQTIQADPIHIEHLLRNLFRNSIEHGDEAVTVRVGDLANGFYVEDDGPGIPEDARGEVVDAGFTTKADGIGLGLTFVVQLVELYKWRCTITDSETGGARFEFTDVDRVSPAEKLDRH